MKKILFFVLIFSNLSLLAASGDVTSVTVHSNQDLHSQGSAYKGKYDEVAIFPDETKDFQEIKLSFTVGCNNAGVCSHWDYDMDIYVGEYSDELDSTIVSFDTLTYQRLILDTLSTNPLVLDTISNAPLEIDTLQNYVFIADTNWNVFNVIIWHELGRMITPYGTYMDDTNLSDGWDNTWLHTYTYDVTDFRPLLTGTAPVRVRYHGWQAGWRVTTKFDFVEGKPTRDVLDVENVYSGGTYNTFAQFDAAMTPEKTISIPEDATGAKLKVIVTGHGQYGEFTPHSYTLKSNGNVVRAEEMWRDDCGLVAIAPQGGTWIYNRANWCPGDKVEVHEFELTDYISGTGTNKSLNLDIDFDDFVPSAAASYSLSAQLVTYKDIRRRYDAAVTEIIAPSTNENFVRFNSICANPIVRIKNVGSETLTALDIKYWVDATNYRYFEWTGSLEMGEEEDVTLDQMDWSGVNVSNPEFSAEVSWPNGVPDQFAPNNTKTESFVFPDVFTTNNIKIRFRSNNQPGENSYTVKDGEGNIIADESGFPASYTNDKDLSLSSGCYVLEFYDVDNYWGLDGGGDGISWWVNTQNSLESAGYVRILSGTNATLKTFNPDFGSKIFYSFTIMDALDELDLLPAHQEPNHPTVEVVVIDGEEYQLVDGVYYGEDKIISGINDLEASIEYIQVYPNPAANEVSLYLKAEESKTVQISLQSVIGEEISSYEMNTNQLKKIALKDLSNGVYFLQFEIEGKTALRKLVVNR